MKECGWKFDLKNLQYPVNFPPLPTISPTQNHAYTSAANTALAPTVRMSISPARARLAAATALVCVLEAVTTQIDNLLLPPVYFAALLAAGPLVLDSQTS